MKKKQFLLKFISEGINLTCARCNFVDLESSIELLKTKQYLLKYVSTKLQKKTNESMIIHI